MKLPTPRPYQEKGLNLLKKAYVDGKRKILFFAATGSGKTCVAQHIVKGGLDKNKKILFVVKRRQVVLQSKRIFERVGILTSVLMGNEKGFISHLNFHIASIDTISRRDLEFIHGFDMVIIDECHDSTSDNYVEFLNYCQETAKIPFYVGLTATPFPVGKKSHTFWDACVKPIEMHELREQGYLTPADIYIPHEVDLKGVSVRAGDFASGELSKAMQKLSVIGDVIETYKTKGQNKAAVCFCVDKEHSMRMALDFSKAGIPASHCDESTKQKERDIAINELQAGKIKVLCNVNIFSTGVDIPEAEIGIMARPTKSEILYIQQAGRLLRPYRKCGKCSRSYDNSKACPYCGYDKPSYIKQKAIILDHGNNTSRFGDIYDIRYPALTEEDVKARDEDKEENIKIKTCKNCFLSYSAHLPCCPACGDNTVKERIYKTEDGELRPYDEYEMIKNEFTNLQRFQLQYGRKENWKYFKLYERFGEKVMKYKKELKVPKWIPKIYKKNQEELLKGKLYTGNN